MACEDKLENIVQEYIVFYNGTAALYASFFAVTQSSLRIIGATEAAGPPVVTMTTRWSFTYK